MKIISNAKKIGYIAKTIWFIMKMICYIIKKIIFTIKKIIFVTKKIVYATTKIVVMQNQTFFMVKKPFFVNDSTASKLNQCLSEAAKGLSKWQLARFTSISGFSRLSNTVTVNNSPRNLQLWQIPAF